MSNENSVIKFVNLSSVISVENVIQIKFTVIFLASLVPLCFAAVGFFFQNCFCDNSSKSPLKLKGR